MTMHNVSVFIKKSDWVQALSKCERCDFYHTWDYHNVSFFNGEGSPILFDVNINGRGLIFPLLERSIEGEVKKDLTSVYGYPGPLLYGDVDETYFNELWSCFVSFLVDNGYVSLFSRCHPLYFNGYIKNHSDFSGEVVFIDLYLSEDEQWRFYRGNHRRDINKLNKIGVVCHYDDDSSNLDEFIDNYYSTMNKLNASDFYFFSRDYYLKLIESTDFKARLYSCVYNGEVICSGFFVFFKEIVQYHLGGTKPGFYHLSPTKMMFDKVRRDAMELGCKYFCLGGGVGGRSGSLFNFKLGFSKHVEEFRTIKLILDESSYRELSSHATGDDSFFPKYRIKP
ncbi:GNAT family N-acetyltransferase [Zobellella aerophila]|uniref:BioF2-like acetyltransferase domain-containing protein n=1 Tax=Zobellella aerophila TaxID=870480 RepID=A0ABP6VLX1_9GAMM